MNEYYPTTKLCTECNHIYRDLKLSDRTYVCPCCGHTEDRDVHAVKNMVWLYNHFKIGVDSSEFKHDEFLKQLDEIVLIKQSDGV